MRRMKSVICCMLLSMMLTANVACGNTSGGKSESTAPDIRGKGIVKEKNHACYSDKELAICRQQCAIFDSDAATIARQPVYGYLREQ